MSFVYVCYEANYRDCAFDEGPVNNIEILGSPELAVEWINERIQKAHDSGYVREGKINISDSEILEKVKLGRFTLKVYRGYRKSCNRDYEIIVERKEVQVSEEQKETDNYKKFKSILAETISVEAMEQYWLGNPDELLRQNIDDIFRKIRTDKNCPKCGATLCLSDLTQYDYVCTLCDENFYECEVKE